MFCRAFKNFLHPKAAQSSIVHSGKEYKRLIRKHLKVYSSGVVPNDTNSVSDIFVRDTLPLGPTIYCTAGTTSLACVAAISATGTASASHASNLVITVASLNGQTSGMAFYGLNNASFSPQSWGGGTSYLCVKPPLQRMAVQNSGGGAGTCDGTLVANWNTFLSSQPQALGMPFSAGQHVYAQGWFRDPPSPKTTSLSDALEFIVGP